MGDEFPKVLQKMFDLLIKGKFKENPLNFLLIWTSFCFDICVNVA